MIGWKVVCKIDGKEVVCEIVGQAVTDEGLTGFPIYHDNCIKMVWFGGDVSFKVVERK
ncbi:MULTISPECIES: hypothetical protein [Vibrio]|uniref:hypothetical protein n=1 Tax=Vibrio TaxID=662 RepID=UPI0015DFA39C|nr:MULTISPECIES: hypothetical protein [Vibrio]MCG6231564.1 hypothetical protein [Vibrio furnissii]MCG6258719.1 hypothetical protein [Vibrio furnissii]